MIVFCSNSTGWDPDRRALIEGGQVDAYTATIRENLPPGGYRVARQPAPGAVNVYVSTRTRYQNMRENGRAGVQLSHGIADKSYRRGASMKTFDYVASPGPRATQQYIRQGTPAHRIVELGYPKLDPYFDGRLGVRTPSPTGRIRVLWAPTHGGGSEAWTSGNPAAPGALATTWWRRNDVLALIDPDEFEVVEAPHPRHRTDGRATLAEYVHADVVIADGGSTIYEAWACGLPVVFCDWISGKRHLGKNARQTRGVRTLECEIYEGQVGYHAKDPDDFQYKLRAAATQGITEPETEFIDGVLPPDVRGCGGKLHAEFLRGL